MSMDAWLPFMALVKRELLTSLRRTRTFFLVAGVSGLVGGWFLSTMIGLSAVNIQAARLLDLFSWSLLLVTFVTVPPLAAVSVCEEKQRETFDLLNTSLIRPSGIVLGKLINALGLYALVIVALLPVLGVLFFFVGIDLADFGARMLGLLATAFLCGAVGMVCSVYSRSPFKAILLSYLFIFLLQLIPFAMPSLGLMSRPGTRLAVLLYLAPPLLIAVLLLVRATSALRRPPRPVYVNPYKPIDNPKLLRLRRRTFPFYLVDPLRRKPLIADHQSAIYRRDVQTSPFSQATFRIRTGYLYFLLTIPFSLPILFSTRGNGLPLVFMHTCVMSVLAPAMAATLMVREYEQENTDMLRMTLMSPREILLGKVQAGLSFLLPMLIASLPFSCLPFFVSIRQGGFVEFAAAYVNLANTLFQVVTISLMATLLCRRTATALVAAYAATGFFLLLLPMGLLSLGGIGLNSSHAYRSGLLEMVIALYPSPVIFHYYSLSEGEGGSPHFTWVVNLIATAVSTAAIFFGGVRFYEKRLLRDR